MDSKLQEWNHSQRSIENIYVRKPKEANDVRKMVSHPYIFRKALQQPVMQSYSMKKFNLYDKSNQQNSNEISLKRNEIANQSIK